eukprot:s130_g36.t1
MSTQSDGSEPGGGGVRTFSSETEDHKEFRRWKLWLVNKFATLDKLPKEARGSYLFTLLRGKALETVEHIEPAEYQKAGGEDVLLKLLERRFPQQDDTDEMAEAMQEVFSLRCKDGESLRQWISRATEVFDKCERKGNVKFPEEARGYMLLKWSGLNEEQQAVVKDFVNRKKAIALVQDELSDSASVSHDEVTGFDDVELLIADYVKAPAEDEADFAEEEVAEVLATSWKDKRAEINRLQKARRFDQAKDLRRSFRVEIEEMKRKTRCNRCGKVGHWARECRQKRDVSQSSGQTAFKPGAKESAASYVAPQPDEQPAFVAAVEPQKTLLQQLRARRSALPEVSQEIMLVSSPGFAVLDSGCGKTIIGQKTLEQFQQLWQKDGRYKPSFKDELNAFKFGNGERETSTLVSIMPIGLCGKFGTVQAAVVAGDAPLLLSRPALKRLGASIDFQNDRLTLFDGRHEIKLKSNAAGQYVIDVFDFPPVSAEHEIHMMQVPCNASECPDLQISVPPVVDNQGYKGVGSNQEHNGVNHEGCNQGNGEVNVEQPDAGRPVSLSPPEFAQSSWSPLPSCPDVIESSHECQFTASVSSSKKQGGVTKKQLRQLQHQLKNPKVGQKYAVVEVFSPPRFVPQVEARGLKGLSLDIRTGWDFNVKANREWAKAELKAHPPELLVVCPPCTDAGGWFHLNALHMPILEVLRRRKQLKRFLTFVKELIQIQIDAGGRFMFEHPTGSVVWEDPQMQEWCSSLTSFVTNMCQFDLHLPARDGKPKRFLRKSTRLLCSHEDMESLALVCPGESAPEHVHAPIAGSEPGIGSISKHAGQYTPQFVNAVLQTVPNLRSCVEVLICEHDGSIQSEAIPIEALAVGAEEPSPEKLLQVLRHLHKNLGHPSNADLIRILKHGQASEAAIRAAKTLECDFCTARQMPTVANPGQVHRVLEFNQRVGLDVKHLPGWLPNQKITAVNMVDYASSFQLMVPFFETETSSVLRKIYLERWVNWAGPPKEVIMDPARTNLGQAMTQPCELEGTHVLVTAAGAHWQLGKTEVHGGWFARVLSKVIEQRNPSSREEWLECVVQSHVKNQMIQNYGFTPSQFIFGKNLEIPGDLLNEPANVTACTSSIQDETLAKRYATRAAARQAVLSLQDDESLRRALVARPRRDKPFASGDVVAYWRDQKWSKGLLSQGGKWYGSGIVIGLVGRNVIVAHRNHIIRCAPEQVRLATNEEKSLIETPETQLLGIKDMIEHGTFRSHQYVDLVAQAYPPQEETVMNPSAQVVVSNDAAPQTDGPASSSVPKADSPEPVVGALEAPPETEAASSSTQSAAVAHPHAELDKSSAYGPIRNVRSRVPSKSGPLTLFRPPAMKQDDFVEVMQEVVPQLIDETIQSEASSHKRSASETAEQPEAKAPRTEESTAPEHPIAYVGVASCEAVESKELWDTFVSSEDTAIEVMVAQYYNKRAQKEIPASNNEPLLQGQVDQAKVSEWQTLIDKQAVRVVPPREARWIRKNQPHRIMGSRYVVVKKPEEDIIENGIQPDPSNLAHWKVKARWCLQGHLDPDLDKKVQQGQLQSPTLSQIGRTILFQLIASNHWLLQLGDVKGAFLEAGPLPQCYRPLYARLPAGGIPGIDEEALIEVLGNVYGQNDAPAAWYKVFNQEVLAAGFERSKYDCCLYYMREGGQLTGILGAHVDDTVTGGQGDRYLEAIKRLIPYRKWRTQEGEFCGVHYSQDATSFEIRMSQQGFSNGLRPASLPKGRKMHRTASLDSKEISVLRGINGSLNWLSSQTRPDLSAQTSISQQSFPNPTVHHLLEANNIIKRAQQFSDLTITFKDIPVSKLRFCCHSDAAFANLGEHTQAGYVIGFSDDELDSGCESPWSPAMWKSFRLPRAVGSTLAAEAQAMVSATGTLEWASLVLAEALDGINDVRDYLTRLQARPPVVITDCKSLFDHLIAVTSPTSIEDRRTSIDIVILRQSLERLKGSLRWVPTNRMLADSLTKNAGDPTDLLRACIRQCTYQISPEETVLQLQAAERQRRLLARSRTVEDDPEAVTPSSFDLIEEDIQAMNDASKRRMSEPAEGDGCRRVYVPEVNPEILAYTVRGKPICLPPGVDSMKSWGRSVIQFGKFMAKKGAIEISYQEVYESGREEDIRYVRWVKGQVDSANGHLLDLAQYFIVRDAQMSPSGQMPLIPGTAVARRLKRARMMDVFARQIRMGVDHDLPVVVHAREADADTLDVLKRFLPKQHKVYIHAYQGGQEMMRETLMEFPNCIFGVSSMVWCSEGAKATAIHCPLERMVLETDAPYLAKEPFEIPSLAEKIAELKGTTMQEVLKVTLDVSEKFYGLGDWSPWSPMQMS